MKFSKSINNIIIIILAIFLIIMGISYKNAHNKNYQFYETINAKFKQSLLMAISGFGLDYDKVNDETLKLYTYNRCISQLSMASSLCEMTSYYSINADLDITLNTLINFMLDSSYKNIIIQNHEMIYKYLSDIYKDPTNTNSTQKLLYFLYKIKFKK